MLSRYFYLTISNEIAFIDDRLLALKAWSFMSLRSRSLRVIKVFGNTKYLLNVNTKVLNDP